MTAYKDEPEKVLFDPDDPTMVLHRKIGIWDWYEDATVARWRFSFLPTFSFGWRGVKESVLRAEPALRRMIQDFGRIPLVRYYLGSYLLATFVSTMLPAVTLWYSTQFLQMVCIFSWQKV